MWPADQENSGRCESRARITFEAKLGLFLYLPRVLNQQQVTWMSQTNHDSNRTDLRSWRPSNPNCASQLSSTGWAIAVGFLIICGTASPRAAAQTSADQALPLEAQTPNVDSSEPLATSAAWQLQSPLPKTVQARPPESLVEQDNRFLRFQCASVTDFQKVVFVSTQAPAAVVDDFRATVAVNCSQRGLRVALRLILPNQTDPRTGQPLVTWLSGDEILDAGKWQTLTVEGGRAALQSRIRQIRTELNQPEIDASGAYFDACGLLTELNRGTTFVDIGASSYAPVVKPEQVVTTTAESTVSDQRPRLRLERNQVMVGNRTLYPRIMPDHDESAEFLQQLGMNGIWVADLHAAERMQLLMNRGMLVLATPPHPEFDPADFGKSLQGLPPLDQSSPEPSIWFLGSGIAADQLPHLLAWAREVRSADKTLRRPLMADVESAEGVASRQIDFVGISQHSAGWLQPFGAARNRSYLRQNASAQLTLPWEWIQTEAAPELAAWRHRCGVRPAFVEPEQILMQLAAALSAGSRGIGFWKTRSLESGAPTDRETATAIELASLYVEILEPLLVKSRVDGHLPISTDISEEDDSKRKGFFSSASFASSAPTDYAKVPTGPDAAIMTAAGTSTILATHWDNASHFVPQQMYAQNAKMTVSATETATAWQIFATGLRGLRRRPVAGGLRLDIRDFDQLAIVVVSSDSGLRRQLEDRIQRRAERAGRLFLDLAELKLTRVTATCAEIDAGIAGSDATASMSLSTAQQQLQAARQAWSRQDFMATEERARNCLRIVRGVQNRYWSRAVQSLSSPLASPHTLCFATLPDHWEMQERMASGSPSANLLPSGSFDSLRLLSEGAWKKIATQEAVFSATADIVNDNRSDSQALQLRAWRRSEEGTVVNGKPTVLVRSPEINGRAGEIYEITVKARLGPNIRPNSSSPFLIFDSDLGPEFAVQPNLQTAWRTVRLHRQLSLDGPFRIWLALDGSAEVLVDDLQVVRRTTGKAVRN